MGAWHSGQASQNTNLVLCMTSTVKCSFHGDITTVLGTSHTASERSYSGPYLGELPETKLSRWRPATAKDANEVLTGKRRNNKFGPLGCARVTDDATDVWIYSMQVTKNHAPVDHAVSWHYKPPRPEPALIAWSAPGSEVGPKVYNTTVGVRPDDHFVEEFDNTVDNELDDEQDTTTSSPPPYIGAAEYPTVSPNALMQPVNCHGLRPNVITGAVSSAPKRSAGRQATVEDYDSDM